MRLYQRTWEKLKAIRPHALEIESHPAFHKRWIKAIRKEAYADRTFKRELAAASHKFTLTISTSEHAIRIAVKTLPLHAVF